MIKIKKIFTDDKSIQYLEKRNLSKQYFKAKENILSGRTNQVDLKLRHPKTEKTYYFRINKQYRALAKLKGENLFVFDILDHQK